LLLNREIIFKENFIYFHSPSDIKKEQCK
jgi:hypothetical protein